MFVLSASKKSKSALPTGKYEACITKIEFDPDYAFNEAFRIKYELTGEDGHTYKYSEVFFNTSSNERTAQFLDYVEEAGIAYLESGLPDIVGLRENVVLKKRANYRKPVIVERSIITDQTPAV